MALPARELRRIQQQINVQQEAVAKGERARASKHVNAEKRRQAADQASSSPTLSNPVQRCLNRGHAVEKHINRC